MYLNAKLAQAPISDSRTTFETEDVSAPFSLVANSCKRGIQKRED